MASLVFALGTLSGSAEKIICNAYSFSAYKIGGVAFTLMDEAEV
jgi:hypothetical protein